MGHEDRATLPVTPTRLVILGHSGFLGQAVATRAVIDHPELKIVGRSASELDLEEKANADYLADVLGPSSILLLCSAVKRQLGDTIDSYERNMRMVATVCRSIERYGVARVVFMSSCAIYGEDVNNLAINEDTPPNIRTFYGLYKWSAELLIKKVCVNLHDTSFICLRPPTVYGPAETVVSYGVGSFLRDYQANGPVMLWGDGEELREMLHVDDLAALVSGLLMHSYCGALNLVAGRSYSFRQALDAVEGALGKRLPVQSRPRSKQKVDHRFDNKRLRSLFADFRFTDLAEGVRRTVLALDKAKTP
jgi:UDP-glucose 4-epimerase